MKKIGLLLMAFWVFNSIAQNSVTFDKNLENARFAELKNNAHAEQLIFVLKENQPISDALFNQIVAAMEQKEGYIQVTQTELQLKVITDSSLPVKDIEDVLNQFGYTFNLLEKGEYRFKTQ